MSFWREVLQVAGLTSGPVLTIGTPLAISSIAEAVTANHAEGNQQNTQENIAADQAPQEADARIRQQEEDAKHMQAQRQREIQQLE